MKHNVVLNPAYSNLLGDIVTLLQDFDNLGEYVTKGDRNVIKKVTVKGVTLNIKKFKTPNFFQALVYQFLRKSKAKRSFEYASILTQKGINTPLPIAFVEQFGFGLKESYYISEHVEYDLDFRVLNHNPQYPQRDEILRQMAAFTFKLHENNINFLDHSPGNTLIKKGPNNTFDFYLIDLNRMRFEVLDLKKRMHNFRRLWLSKKMINIMAPVYAGLVGAPETEVQQWMLFYSKEFQGKVNRKKLRRRK
ncbi:MAG: lipopolysaccharide kinase InaA family protein [Patiriisocius sp.]|uniref:lipopolysaccharide kinase InaA family protein n=1 Tax=Patiriisocius sp. TaxID=2822396 RepID=UPI003EF7EA03